MTPIGALPRPLALVLLAAAGLSAAGCFRHHTIEPGTWRLRLEPRKNDDPSKRFAPPRPRDVEVSVDWGESKKVEEVTVQFVSKKDGQPRVLKGLIEDGEVKEMRGKDPDWTMELWGKVNNSRSISGNAFGRMRQDTGNNEYWFDGTFTLNKAGEAQEVGAAP